VNINKLSDTDDFASEIQRNLMTATSSRKNCCANIN